MTKSKKQFFIVLITQTVSAFSQLLIIKLIAGELSTDEYGTLSLFLTFTVLANQIFFVGIILASGRFYIKSINKKMVDKFYSSLSIVFLINLVFSGILGLFLGTLLNIEILLSIKMILIVLLEATYQISNSITNAKDNRKTVLYHVLVYYLTRVSVLFLLIFISILKISI